MEELAAAVVCLYLVEVGMGLCDLYSKGEGHAQWNQSKKSLLLFSQHVCAELESSGWGCLRESTKLWSHSQEHVVCWVLEVCGDLLGEERKGKCCQLSAADRVTQWIQRGWSFRLFLCRFCTSGMFRTPFVLFRSERWQIGCPAPQQWELFTCDTHILYTYFFLIGLQFCQAFFFFFFPAGNTEQTKKKMVFPL